MDVSVGVGVGGSDGRVICERVRGPLPAPFWARIHAMYVVPLFRLLKVTLLLRAFGFFVLPEPVLPSSGLTCTM